MSFHFGRKKSRSIPLVSFMDMCFLLLIFFLATSFRTSVSFEEKDVYLPTPDNQLGNAAQLVIQVMEGDSIFWLDESAGRVAGEQSGFSFNPEFQKRQILDALWRNGVMTYREFRQRFNAFLAQADQHPEDAYFVLIRMPNPVPFSKLIEIVGWISKAKYQNVKYGCVGGTADQIRHCRNVRLVTEDEGGGVQRENVVIEF
jgi:biopolymer transport protein ExbD